MVARIGSHLDPRRETNTVSLRGSFLFSGASLRVKLYGMKNRSYVAALLLGAAFLLVPALASAHERQAVQINGKPYLFVVGSLNEPVAVDDKTGLDLRVMNPDPANIGDSSSPKATPVVGLEKTLKVELIAGPTKRVQDLAPAYKAPGAYTSQYYPTVATTISYRIFGTIDNTPVDLLFTCMTGEHGTAEDKTSHEVSAGVTRVFQTGGFGCPEAKSDLGFPKPSRPIADIPTGTVNTIVSSLALLVALISLLFSWRKETLRM